MKEHRITSCGNSAAVTLAPDELYHLNLLRGGLVNITKSANGRLIIKATHDQPAHNRQRKAT